MSQKKYTWGLGIEHETALVHETLKTIKGSVMLKDYKNTWRPPYDQFNKRYKSRIDPKQEYNIMMFFDANPALKELVLEKNKTILKILENNQLEPDYHDFSVECKHDTTNQEWLDGSNCSLEFITRNYKNATTEKAVAELTKIETETVKYIKKTVYAEKQIELHGQLKFPEIGSYRYVGYIDKDGLQKYSTNYFGSYHINMTLPYLASETDQKFRNKHLKWAKLIQWIMPLITAIYGSGDAGSFMDDGQLSEGSYRQSTNKFARPGTADLDRGTFPTERKLTYNSEWVTAIMTDLDYPFDPADETGTDFRRDPEKGSRFGFELRIFDHFPREYLQDLITFLWYLADHSQALTNVHSPVNQDNSWKTAIKTVLKDGWNAKLPLSYLRKLRLNLNLPITEKSNLVVDVFRDLIKGLNRLYSSTGQTRSSRGTSSDKSYTDIIYGRAKKPKIVMPQPIPNRTGQLFFIDNYFSNQDAEDQLNQVLNKHLKQTVTEARLVNELNKALGSEVLDEIDDLFDYLIEKKSLKKTPKGWLIKKPLSFLQKA